MMTLEAKPVVSKRAEKLKLPCIQGVEDKATHLERFAADKGTELDRMAYMGNDINDDACLKMVGLPVVVADALPAVKPLAMLVLSRRGGMSRCGSSATWYGRLSANSHENGSFVRRRGARRGYHGGHGAAGGRI